MCAGIVTVEKKQNFKFRHIALQKWEGGSCGVGERVNTVGQKGGGGVALLPLSELELLGTPLPSLPQLPGNFPPLLEFPFFK